MLEIGKLYQIKGNMFWFVFPTKETAEGIEPGHTCPEDMAKIYSKVYSKNRGCSVSYLSPEATVCPVEVDRYYAKVISGEGVVGWIVVYDCFKYFQELKETNQ